MSFQEILRILAKLDGYVGSSKSVKGKSRTGIPVLEIPAYRYDKHRYAHAKVAAVTDMLRLCMVSSIDSAQLANFEKNSMSAPSFRRLRVDGLTPTRSPEFTYNRICA